MKKICPFCELETAQKNPDENYIFECCDKEECQKRQVQDDENTSCGYDAP